MHYLPTPGVLARARRYAYRDKRRTILLNILGTLLAATGWTVVVANLRSPDATSWDVFALTAAGPIVGWFNVTCWMNVLDAARILLGLRSGRLTVDASGTEHADTDGNHEVHYTAFIRPATPEERTLHDATRGIDAEQVTREHHAHKGDRS